MSSQQKDPKSIISLDSDFGKEFMHTMQDDLSSTDKPAYSNTGDEFLSKATPASLGNNSSSPFLNRNKNTGSSQADFPSTFGKKLSTEISKEIPLGIVPDKIQPPLSKKFAQIQSPRGGKFLIIIILFLIICIILGGIYYYFLTSKTSSIKTTNSQEVTSEDSKDDIYNDQIVITPISEKYSTDKPNLLPINIELASPDEIKKIVLNTALELENIQTKIPFEFIVTDSNNLPISFPIFSVAANLNLSSDILSSLEEQFSFYIQKDQGATRTAIVIETKNASQAFAEMQKNESRLAENISFLFPIMPQVVGTAIFKSGQYNGNSVRYSNLDDANNISIDYAVYKDKLIIGTSKEALRAIIDKLSIL